MNLDKIDAKKCFTVAGVLINKEKVLLVHHRKLNIWLPPGGHVDKNELPHQAAEREFFEETMVKVTAYSPEGQLASTESQYLPNPFATNLHWISQQNYQNRKQGQSPVDDKGCEQHYVLIYLVAANQSDIKISVQKSEVFDARWFTQSELRSLDATQDVKSELIHAFQLVI